MRDDPSNVDAYLQPPRHTVTKEWDVEKLRKATTGSGASTQIPICREASKNLTQLCLEAHGEN